MEYSYAVNKAEALLKLSQWQQVIALLEPFMAESSLMSAADGRKGHQALAVAHVMLYGRNGEWFRVLMLTGEDSSAEAVKKQFRRISLLIHPDQCPFHGASEAFVLLSEAQRQALKRRGGDEVEGSRNVKQRSNVEGEGEEEDVQVEEGFEWWTDWYGHKTQDHSTCTYVYLSELSGLSTEDLRDRVVQLQRQLLAPSDSSISLVERKERLRAARSMLAEKLSTRK